jgi:hypothetical protein
LAVASDYNASGIDRSGELGPQQGNARVFAERQVIGKNLSPAQQLRDHALMNVGVLAQIEAGEVKAQRLDRADQTPERAAGTQNPATVRRERSLDRAQVGQQPVRPAIRCPARTTGRAGARPVSA